MLDRFDAAMHLLAVVSVWLSGIGWSWRLCLTALLLVHYGFRLALCGGRSGGQQLGWSEAVGWFLEEEGGAVLPLRILPGTVVSPWGVLIRGHDGQRFRSWVVARDSLDADNFRRLRVYLSVHPLPQENVRSLSDTRL